MKKYMFLMILVFACSNQDKNVNRKISLTGEWQFKIDSLDKGVAEKWYDNIFEESVRLPGSMAENGKGYNVSLTTDWTGDIIDRSFFTEKKYEKYRQPGNFKVPFWLQPVKYYKGVAWYQKDIDLPVYPNGERVFLFLERPHWESTLFVNGKMAGSENSLAVAHQYDITDFLVKGKNRFSIRMNNKVVVPVGVNSHSISDHTQSNWNGIAGELSIRTTSSVYIDDIKIYPDIKEKKAKIVVSVKNHSGTDFRGEILLKAESFNSILVQKLKRKKVAAETGSEELQIIEDYPMGDRVQLWNEFSPVLYTMSVSLKDSDGKIIDNQSREFGMREFRSSGTHFEVNGIRTFLRGTLECCIFPLTGYPPTDLKSWEIILQTCKDYGLNTIRFHSWCPPEAAFSAADRLGMYFHIECSSWANQGTALGEGGIIDEYIYREGDRILTAYGNHPSFCMLAYGNEPAGNKQSEYLGKLLTYWKARDNRHLYTSAAGWPFIPENDYNLSPEPRIQRWGEGLKSIINGRAPQTVFDYGEYVSKFNIPVVSHEIGQWCVYPDFKEIDKYTGVLKAKNFEIFKESLEENKMGDQAEDFLMASGKLQTLCYKADIEAALRTPGFAGFHLLQLHDFPGQGTALVGILNPFFESKGYVTPEEFRMFCNSTVPLARMKKMVYQNNESFSADLEIAHFGDKPLEKPVIICKILNTEGDTLFESTIPKDKIETGNCIKIGSFTYNLSGLTVAQKLVFEVSIKGTPFKNRWDFWVYPSGQEVKSGKVCVMDKLDENAYRILKNGGSLLLLTYGKVASGKGAEVAVGFSSIFWNTSWTRNQPPHTLGILCDPKHPAFSSFPTEYHSNWQWWDPVAHSQAMIIDGLPATLKPIIQPIDDWFKNRRLALAFEARTNGGRILVCSIDMRDLTDERIVTRQLMSSILDYMNSSSFDPRTEVEIKKIRELISQK
jgi:hypothetical protein